MISRDGIVDVTLAAKWDCYVSEITVFPLEMYFSLTTCSPASSIRFEQISTENLYIEFPKKLELIDFRWSLSCVYLFPFISLALSVKS